MKKLIFFILLIGMALPAAARIRVAAAYPYIADIVRQVGKNRVSVKALARGKWDPHVIVPRPSLIATVRRADLLIINGAELEIGWIPPIIREAKNNRVQPGKRGFLDLSPYIHLIEVPENVSRSQGDIHPSGNPHFNTDPSAVPILAKVIAERLSEVDAGGRILYAKNLRDFLTLWKKKLAEWDAKMKPFRGTRLVQYHRIFDYFLKRYGIISVIELEPLPGIPPTAGHMRKVINMMKREGIKLILNDVYHSKNPAEFVASRTGARIIVLPHDVGSMKGTGDIVSYFDTMVRRMTGD